MKGLRLNQQKTEIYPCKTDAKHLLFSERHMGIIVVSDTLI